MAAAGNGGAACRARRSLELTNTKETNAWEGLAIGAVTLARTFSTGSHRITSSTICRSGAGERVGKPAGGGLPGAVRRAFSMRRHPAGLGKGDGYYWRIHDNMDGDSDDGDNPAAAAAAAGEDREEEERNKKEQLAEAVDQKKKEKLAEAADEKKKEQLAEAADEKESATATVTAKKKRGGRIMKACKKLLRL
uniref:Uncharacterized protein n=1 Tax=Oryza punctata TaxID=4537 RepID=A0A0E0L2T9_ORYPU